MLRIIIIVCCVVAVIFYTCKPGTEFSDLDYTIIKVDPGNADNSLKASSVYSTIEYIILETNEESLFGKISQMVIHNERFYILDRDHTKAVYCFDNKGNFIYKIDRYGAGPGEYLSLNNISIDYDQNLLLLHCGRKQQIHSFDLGGNYLSSVNLNFHAFDFSYVGKGYSVFNCQYARNSDLELNNAYPNLIFTQGENFTISEQKMYFPDSYPASGAITMLALPFSKSADSLTAYMSIYNDTIYHIKGNNLSNAYYFDFGQKKKDANFYNLLEGKETRLDQILNHLETNDICTMIIFLETSEQIYFGYKRQFDFHFAYYKKSSNELIDVFQTLDNLRINKMPFINDLDGGPFPLPFSSDGTFFYSMLQPYQLIVAKEEILNSGASNVDGLMEVINKVTENCNPIIAKISPKL